MRRREFIALLGSAAVWPRKARAQQGTPRTIGVLALGNPDPARFIKALRDELHDLGYREGQDIQLEVRSAGGNQAALAVQAAQLVARKVEVIVAFQTPAATAAKRATEAIPIVISAGDPVATILVDSIARPGGNVTGVSPVGDETAAKNLEVLREVLPSTRRVAVLANPNDPFHVPYLQRIQAGAGPLNIDIKSVMVRSADELERDFGDIATWRADAALVQPSIAREAIANLAIKYRIATASHHPGFTELGGLISYSADFDAISRRCAYFVDKIFKGSKPADLPVELPNKFWLAINLKTAKALGITVPSTILVRADELIE